MNNIKIPAHKKYENFISLGFFCSVALELERIGLRSTSSPFDWQISNFCGVMELMENGFSDFCTYEYLAQNKNYPQYYKNIKYNIEFFHDFNKYQPLVEQLPKVKRKYERRIKKFYDNIRKPTLFIRYISGEKKEANGKCAELNWIEDNYENILNCIRKYNDQNDIIFIANSNVTSDIIKIFNVEPDEGDVVSRKPLEKNSELMDLLSSFDYEKRNNNLEVYRKKMKKKNNFFGKNWKRLVNKTKNIVLKVYVHDKIY